LPSIAITIRFMTWADLVHNQAPSATVEFVRIDRGERSPERGLLRRAPRRPQSDQHTSTRVTGPLPDRSERTRTRNHRSDPDREQPRQRMPATAFLPRIRDLGQQIKQILATGNRHRNSDRRR
jgi:hypothetical protein